MGLNSLVFPLLGFVFDASASKDKKIREMSRRRNLSPWSCFGARFAMNCYTPQE